MLCQNHTFMVKSLWGVIDMRKLVWHFCEWNFTTNEEEQPALYVNLRSVDYANDQISLTSMKHVCVLKRVWWNWCGRLKWTNREGTLKKILKCSCMQPIVRFYCFDWLLLLSSVLLPALAGSCFQQTSYDKPFVHYFPSTIKAESTKWCIEQLKNQIFISGFDEAEWEYWTYIHPVLLAE